MLLLVRCGGRSLCLWRRRLIRCRFRRIVFIIVRCRRGVLMWRITLAVILIGRLVCVRIRLRRRRFGVRRRRCRLCLDLCWARLMFMRRRLVRRWRRCM